VNRAVFSRAWTAVPQLDWWAHAIPPLLSVACAGFIRFEPSPRTWVTVGCVLASVFLVAGWSYVLNDVCDVVADRLGRRPNRTATVGIAARIALMVLLAAGALALAWLPGDAVLVALATLNLVLRILHIVPPVRFKGRRLLGALGEAGGVHAVPVALVARAVTLDAAGPGWLVATFVATATGAALFAGLRGTSVHQVRDQRADEPADVNTFGGAAGLAQAYRLVMRSVLLAEIASLGVLLAIVLPHAPAAAIVVGAFAVLELVKVRRGWKRQFVDQTGTERAVALVSAEIYEVWLPFAFALQLALRVPVLWLLVAVQAAMSVPNLRIGVGGLPAPSPDRPSGQWPPTRRRRPADFQVILGTTLWTVNGVNVFSANLARGLAEEGVPSHIVVTEQETDLVASHEVMMPRPADVPIELLPVGRTNGWGRHWGSMVRYLEEAAPCVYIPNHDWRHSLISSQLSNDVVVVGIVHSDDPMHYDHVRRVGRYWNALVAVSDAVARKTVELCPEVADRITTIPIGVRIPASQPLAPASGRFRVIYHGILKQHQKRVLDLPRIVQAALDLGVPIDLTIVGAGPDEAALRSASASLVSSGAIRFLGVVSPDDTPSILEAHDVYLLASEFEGMPNALIEAMGRGLVPVVSRMTSAISELVRDGENGFVVPVGDAGAFANHLRALWTDPVRRHRMAAQAYRTVSTGHFRVEDMVKSYRKVFDRAWDDARAGRFVRPKGPISPLPAEVAGVGVFPIETPHVVPDLGAFPSLEDAEDYGDEIRMLRKGSASLRLAPTKSCRASLDHVRVIVASPVWTHNGVNLWSEEVVRGFRSARVDARLLLTEESTRLVTIDEPRMARPSDIPVEELRVSGADNWGARWGAMVRTLEAAAPCIYIPNYDWRHSCVVPALSRRVAVVGLLHDAGPLYTEHASRLGDYWNAVVATSRPIARHVRKTLPQLSNRVATIPHGCVAVPAAPVEKRWITAAGTVLIPGGGYGEWVRPFVQAFPRSSGPSPFIAVDPPEGVRAWLEAAGVRMVIRPGRLVWLELCASSHFVVSVGRDPAFGLLVVEAMGHGCIPITVESGLPDTDAGRQVRDAGISVPDGQWHDADRLLHELMQDADRRNRMAAAAHRMAHETAYRSEQMIAAYLELFQRVIADANSGYFSRHRGGVLPPPAFVEGISIFPVPLTHSTDAGTFATPDDEASYRAERRGRGGPAAVGLQ